jgi:hypothetical protein
VYYQPDLIRCWTLDRGSSATNHRSGGNQPAHQSMINRRFLIVLPALPSSGHAEQLEQTSEDFLRLLLETANMRVLQLRTLAASIMRLCGVGLVVASPFGPSEHEVDSGDWRE